MKINYDYESPQIPEIAGTRNKLYAHIQNISERIKTIELFYKPNVTFNNNRAVFYFQVYDFVKENTFTLIKKNCMDIVKIILKNACTDIFDKTGEDFKYKYIIDHINVTHSAGKNSKSYMDYTQTWEIE